MGIRVKLTIGMAVLLLIGFSLLGWVVVATTRAALIEQVDARVRTATTRMDTDDSAGSSHRGGRDEARDEGRGRDRPNEGLPLPLDIALAPAETEQTSGGETAFVLVDEPSPTPSALSNGYERPIARMLCSSEGKILDASPSGYPDEPDPLPVLPTSSGAELAKLEGRIVTLMATDGNLTYRALIDRRGDGALEVTAAPLSDVEETVSQVVRAAAIAALATLAVAALGGWWLIRAGLRPVDRMIDTAAAIAGGDLSRRVPEANPRTELGQLGMALNEMLGQIERSTAARAASEERLRRFVADAAHELRTPLTSLQGYSELYGQGALATPEAMGNAMTRMGASASRMGRLVEDLLLLARLDQQRILEQEPVDLAALAGEAAADFIATAPDHPLRQQIEGEAVVLGDRTRLR